jgi:hypothetical protein
MYVWLAISSWQLLWQFVQRRRFGFGGKNISGIERALDSIFERAESALRSCKSIKSRSSHDGTLDLHTVEGQSVLLSEPDCLLHHL